MRTVLTLVGSIVLLASAPIVAQNRPASPRGQAATELGGSWDTSGRPTYKGGKWIEIDYGRPILRQRPNIFGSGEDYGKQVNAGAPVWRAGANQSTRLKTEVALKFGETVVPAGEYSLFIELASPTEWTLIVSSWAAQEKFDRNDKTALWGAYGYTPDKDVARAPMTVAQMPARIDELTWGFADVTTTGGTLGIVWDTTQATVPFQIAE